MINPEVIYLEQCEIIAKERGVDFSSLPRLTALEMCDEALHEGIAPHMFVEQLEREAIRASQLNTLKEKMDSGEGIDSSAVQAVMGEKAKTARHSLQASVKRQIKFFRNANYGRLGVGKEEYIKAEILRFLSRTDPDFRTLKARKAFISNCYEAQGEIEPDETVVNRGKKVYEIFVMDSEPKDGDIEKAVSSRDYTDDRGNPKSFPLYKVDLDKLSSLAHIAKYAPHSKDRIAALAANTSRAVVVQLAQWFHPDTVNEQIDQLWEIKFRIYDEDDKEKFIEVPAMSQNTPEGDTAILNWLSDLSGKPLRLTKTITIDYVLYEEMIQPFREKLTEFIGQEPTASQFLEMHIKPFYEMMEGNPKRYLNFLGNSGLVDPARADMILKNLGVEDEE